MGHEGLRILKNFLSRAKELLPFHIEDFKRELIDGIREQVGDEFDALVASLNQPAALDQLPPDDDGGAGKAIASEDAGRRRPPDGIGGNLRG